MNLHDGAQGRSPASNLGQEQPLNTAATRSPKKPRFGKVTGAVAIAAVLGIGAAVGFGHNQEIAGTAVAAQVTTDEAAAQPVLPGGGTTGRSPWGSSGGQSGAGQSGGTGGGQFGGGYGSGGLGSGSTGSSTFGLASATTAQQVGVVAIDTVLEYQGAEAAGTGMVLTSDGEILTNNHVIEGSTSITVTIVSSGESYSASVVGTDATDDIAVLQLSGASNLDTAHFSDGSAVSVGEAVTGVGNAGGVGGTPSASSGVVTAVNQTITTQAESGAASETLHGLIETNADIQAGDSGGPLFNADDQIVGIDTAAQAGGYTTAGYAIPIASALTIAQQIQNGQASANIVIGLPAFIGVQVSSTTSAGSRYSQATTTQGALIGGVVSGAPAAMAGITAGDTITAIDGNSVSSASALTSALAGYHPGENVTITWVGTSGASESASVTLASGPAL